MSNRSKSNEEERSVALRTVESDRAGVNERIPARRARRGSIDDNDDISISEEAYAIGSPPAKARRSRRNAPVVNTHTEETLVATTPDLKEVAAAERLNKAAAEAAKDENNGRPSLQDLRYSHALSPPRLLCCFFVHRLMLLFLLGARCTLLSRAEGRRC
jgi:hypothetical protein